MELGHIVAALLNHVGHLVQKNVVIDADPGARRFGAADVGAGIGMIKTAGWRKMVEIPMG